MTIENEVKAAQAKRPAWQPGMLIVGVLLGASLGPALFLAIDRLELKGEILLSFSIGAFLAFSFCLVLAAITVLLILPRFVSGVQGTLVGVVDDLAEAGRSHAQGDPDATFAHLGRAAREAAAWYSIGATRRFVAQAALGLIISFGGIIGAVLLFSQNALLRDQNEKIDKQLVLLTQQNEKIDQQTAVADAQKRSAFVTELFSIVQEVSKEADKIRRSLDRALPPELVSRIAVLTSSAVPYRYLDQHDERKRSIPIALSPERGQLVVALVRMNILLVPLIEAGADFSYSDLRGFDLSRINFSHAHLVGCDFSYSDLSYAQFEDANLTHAVLRDLKDAAGIKFKKAILWETKIERSRLVEATFDHARVMNVTIKDSELTGSSFVEAGPLLKLENVTLRTYKTELPAGIRWSPEIEKAFAAAKERREDRFEVSITVPPPDSGPGPVPLVRQ